MAMFCNVYERMVRKHFRRWHSRATRSRRMPISEVGRMLKRRFQNITTYPQRRVTNAESESINAKI